MFPFFSVDTAQLPVAAETFGRRDDPVLKAEKSSGYEPLTQQICGNEFIQRPAIGDRKLPKDLIFVERIALEIFGMIDDSNLEQAKCYSLEIKDRLSKFTNNSNPRYKQTIEELDKLIKGIDQNLSTDTLLNLESRFSKALKKEAYNARFSKVELQSSALQRSLNSALQAGIARARRDFPQTV